MDHRSTLREFFKSEDNFPLVVLFGSYARGTQTESSDLDLAFFSRQKMTLDERLSLQENLQNLWKMNVDLVDLSEAHGALLQEILVRGTIVKNEEPAVYERLIGRMLGEKEDDARMLKKIVDQRLK